MRYDPNNVEFFHYSHTRMVGFQLRLFSILNVIMKQKLPFMSIFCCITFVLSEKNYTIKPGVVLPDNYVKEIRPPSSKGAPVSVDVSIYVVDINSINVEDMDFRIDMFVRQRWTESRLHMPNDLFEEGDDYVTLPPEFVDNLWQPDPYILNAKVSEIAKLQHKFVSVTLYRNKSVRFAARMHAIIACQMEFQLYPMDIQVCPMHIESFSYSTQKLRLRWGQEAVAVNPELKLLQYNVGEPLQMEETTGYMQEREANFSRLVLYFRFERQIGHHLIQTFAPSALVVMLSWFSFWLGLDAIPGRVTLLVTSMLTLVTMFTGLKSDIPPVAYVKALDLWMAGCMVFVFAALGEFVVVKVLQMRLQAERATYPLPLPRPRPITKDTLLPTCQHATGHVWDAEVTAPRCRKPSLSVALAMGMGVGTGTRPRRRRRLVQLQWVDRRTGGERLLWREIDRQATVIFPVFFLLFVLFYWPILLLKKAQLLAS